MSRDKTDEYLVKIEKAAKRFKTLCLSMLGEGRYGKVAIELPFEDGVPQRKRCIVDEVTED